MRTAYREHLNAFANDVLVLCDMVNSIMTKSADALLRASLASAEEALSQEEELRAVRSRCEERAVELLALEGPVERDLRQVVSSIYIVEDFRRMGALAMHIASSARRRHPEKAIPEELESYYRQLSELCIDMVSAVRDLLLTPDADRAAALNSDDDAVDNLHSSLMHILTQRPWEHSAREAVDAALIARFYERYADHCVNVAARIIYLTTGRNREDYLAQRNRTAQEEEFSRHLAELDRRFSHRDR